MCYNRYMNNKRQARIDYVLITNVQKDFEGMVEEMNEYYKNYYKELCNELQSMNPSGNQPQA